MKIMDIPHGEPEQEPTRKDKLAVAAFFKDDCLSFNPEERQRMLAYVLKGIVRAEEVSILNGGPISKTLFRYFRDVMAFCTDAPPKTSRDATRILQKLLNDLNETLDKRGMTAQMPSCLESFANLTRLAAATPADVVDAAFNFQKTKEVSRMWEKIIDDEFTAYRKELEADRQRLIAAGFISGEN
jgi:hypothetical protein